MPISPLLRPSNRHQSTLASHSLHELLLIVVLSHEDILAALDLRCTVPGVFVNFATDEIRVLRDRRSTTFGVLGGGGSSGGVVAGAEQDQDVENQCEDEY